MGNPEAHRISTSGIRSAVYCIQYIFHFTYYSLNVWGFSLVLLYALCPSLLIPSYDAFSHIQDLLKHNGIFFYLKKKRVKETQILIQPPP